MLLLLLQLYQCNSNSNRNSNSNSNNNSNSNSNRVAPPFPLPSKIRFFLTMLSAILYNYVSKHFFDMQRRRFINILRFACAFNFCGGRLTGPQAHTKRVNSPNLHSGTMPQEMQKDMKICTEGVPGYKSINNYIYTA